MEEQNTVIHHKEGCTTGKANRDYVGSTTIQRDPVASLLGRYSRVILSVNLNNVPNKRGRETGVGKAIAVYR